MRNILASFAEWVVLPEPCKPHIMMMVGILEEKLMRLSVEPISSVSSSRTILMTCCAGVRLERTSSPTAFSVTFLTKSLATL